MSSEGIFSEIISQWLWILGIGLLATALLAGVLLLLAPAQMLRLADYLNREYSFNWLASILDQPRYIEPFIYRHHRVSGLILTVLTAYFLWRAGTAFIPPVVPPTPYIILVVFNAMAFLLGVVIFTRPSLLKRTERTANRWLHTEALARLLDKRFDKPDRLARRYPRALGAVILVLVLYIAAVVVSLT